MFMDLMRRLSLLLFLLLSFSGFSQEVRKEVVSFEDAYKRVYHITELGQEERPAIDGKLDEDIWQSKGEWSEKFSQVIPFERVFTASWTRVKLFYDDENIYVGVYCKDAHPETMNAFIGNRDDNSNGDLISIAFDTYHDYRVAPEFNINLGGNKTDLTVTDKLSVNLSWNAVWEGRTHINLPDSSWTAELRIPFSQLRYNHQDQEGVWGLHVRRIIRRNNEVQNWSLIPIKNNGHVYSFGEMHGMKNLPKPRGIEILPYVMAQLTREPVIPNSPFHQGAEWGLDGGLDAKVALNDFTMDLTINPDYGQVELDPSVMNLTAFETFYDEKRPFFLEGRHILEFDNDADSKMFYSRRIGAMPSRQPEADQIRNFAESPDYIPIIGAMKLTGTNRQGLTVGVLQSVTAETHSKVMRNGVRGSETTEPLTNYSIARIQKNWGGNTLLGGMITSVNRHLNEDYLENSMIRNAFTAGIDFTQYFANRLYYIDLKGMYSSLHGSKEAVLQTMTDPTHYFHRQSGTSYLDPDPESEELKGSGGYLKVGRRGNAQWNFSETFSWSSPGFDLNQVGYLKQSDYLSNESEITFRKTDPWGPMRFTGINLTQKNVWNYGGQSVHNDLAVRWRSLSIKRRSEIDFQEIFSWNTVDSRRLRGGPDLRYNSNFETHFTFGTDRARRTVFRFEYNGKHFLQKDTRYNDFHPGIIQRLGNHIKLTGQLDFARNKDDLQYVATAYADETALTEQPEYVMGRMQQKTYGFTLKAEVNITPDFSVQYYGSPYTSAARYDRFKLARETLSSGYSDRFEVISPSNLNTDDGFYGFRQDDAIYRFEDPDFSFNEFRSNLVVRWEYLPGSTLYLVWQQNLSGRDRSYIHDWAGNLDRMFSLPSSSLFIMKVNYWLNP